MKKLFLLSCFSFFVFDAAFGQGGTWTWISGSNQQADPGVYGTQGIPSVNNYPPANYEMVEWKDNQGNFWLYGGTYPNNSDLWKFNPFTLEWTWVMGNGQSNVAPVYGTKGVGSPANTPGEASYGACTWVDKSGALWLFGGDNHIFADVTNDLWRYDISTNEWTWMSGNNTNKGTHGTLGVPNPANAPGSRVECASSWTDSLNNLWLFGGFGFDENGTNGNLNDMMKYSVSTNEWTWEKGSAYAGAIAVYGTKGVSNTNNDPGARWTYNRWVDKQGSFWLMGGEGGNYLNDMWKYNPANNQWTWMTGPDSNDDAGNYGAKCVFDSLYNPGSRAEQRSSVTDNCGRFWLFGGYYGSYAFNDLWLFDPQLVQWKWLSGSSTTNQPGNYGIKGVPSPANIPPSRMGANAWWGNDNKFYTFGGFYADVSGTTQADLWVFNPDTTCIPQCNSVSVPPPVANFESNKKAICENDCINFTDLSTNATSWRWLFAGTIDSTSTTQNPQSICYLTAGIYSVTLVVSNSGGSDTLSINNYITVSAAPPIPKITQVGAMLYCSTDSSYASYQWYSDTTLIAGATDSSLAITHGGNYNVSVGNANGCSIAVGINIILGLQNYMSDHVVSLWPNPVKDKFIVYGLRFTVASVEIYNVLGQVCQQSSITNPQSEIDVSELPSGIYFVQLSGEKERWIGKFVKQ